MAETTPNKLFEMFALYGKLSMLKLLIEKHKYDPKQRGTNDRTLLYYASAGGHLDTVKYLIDEYQLDPSSNSDVNDTPLHVACGFGHLDVVKYLVDEQSVDPAAASSDNVTPLHVACGMGHLEVVKFLIEEKGCNCTQMCQKKEGFAISPLHSACKNGHLHIVRYLVDEQLVDPTKNDNITSWTPLHAACSKGHLEIVKHLIEEKRCDHTQVYQEEESLPVSPLHVACGYGHIDIVRYLVDGQSVDPAGASSDNVTPLHAACAMGYLEIVKFLIEEKGCNPAQTYCTEEGVEISPLHSACETGHVDIVRYLVDEQSVDPNSDNSTGTSFTPLHMACSEGQLEVVKFLIEKGCDPSQMHHNKERGAVLGILDVACGRGHVDVAKYLIEEKGCDPMGNTASTHPPLFLACQNGHLEVVKYLVNEKSLDPVHELKDGSTAFLVACWHGQLDIVKFLTEEKGCNPMYSNGIYPTPYAAACNSGNLDIVRYLTEEKQCDPLSKDVEGIPALRLCKVNILKYFVEERGCDLEPKGATLRAAIKKGDLEAFQYLSTLTMQQFMTCDILSLPTQTQKQQDEVPQRSVQPEGGCELIPGDAQLAVVGHPQQICSSPKEQKDHLAPSDEPSLPQRKRKQQKASEVPQPKKQHRKEDTHPHSRLQQHQLNPDDLVFLMDHLHPIASHWRAFGLQLGLLPGELDIIAATPLLIPGGPVAYLQELLSRWLSRAPPFPTLTNLCVALKSQTVNQSRIAHILQRKYQTRRTAQRWEDDPEFKLLIKKAEPTGMQLGVGSYGSVEQVKVEGAVYAAKRYRVEICMNPDEFYKKFFTEFRILFSLRHPNIIQYQCVCLLPDSKLPALVMEQLQTNLHDYLLNPSYANLPLNAKVSILHDIGKGLAYLHNNKPLVIHRDLTAKNVLLSSERVAKISDFGNSRIIDIDPECSSEFRSTTHVPGTIVYMPPEACSDHAKFNEKLDIFSFGHLALFTATQVFPCDLLPATFCDDGGNLCARTEVERCQKYIDQLQQQVGEDHNLELIKLIKQSLHNSPRIRPTSDDIVCILEPLVAIYTTNLACSVIYK